MTSSYSPKGLGTSPSRLGARARQAAEGDKWAWVFVGPSLIGLALFYGWPILQTAYFSFTKWGNFGGSTWIGAANYTQVFSDPEVGQSIVNTLVYTAIVLLGIPISIFFASLINRPGLRFAQFYRVAFFTPYIAMPVAVAMVWRIIYNGDFGILNWVLGLVGIRGEYWLSTPGWALIAVGVVGMWASMGFNMIVLSAGLKSIPTEYYEAAQLDGASNWRQFRSVTVPLLTPSIFFVMIITVINGFQLFDLLYALLGPNNPAQAQTESMVYLFYKESFLMHDQGRGAAIAMLILVVVASVTFFQFRIQRRWVHND